MYPKHVNININKLRLVLQLDLLYDIEKDKILEPTIL